MTIKVLTIDDDPVLTNIIKLGLSRELFEVAIANSGPDGIETSRCWQPDVILLDLMMPEMDGFQVCRTIRTFSQAPILILSALSQSETIRRAFEAGANDYLVKPAPASELVARLKILVQQDCNGSQLS